MRSTRRGIRARTTWSTFYKDKLWVMGGSTNYGDPADTPLNDVWFLDLSGKTPSVSITPDKYGWLQTGDEFELRVRVSGIDEPTTYQWYHDGTAIPGQTNAIYRVDEAGHSDNGAYTCVVTDHYGAPYTAGPSLVTIFPAGSLPTGSPACCAIAILIIVLAGVRARQRQV